MIHRFRILNIALGLLLLAGESSADVLHLKRGGRIDGIIVAESPSQITIDVGMGRVSLPRTSVSRVERKEGALSEYRQRLAAISPGDVGAYADLARFAAEHGLNTESRALWARVVSLDPRNVEGHLALGHVLVGGSYVDEAEAYRARGYVSFEGRWMTPAEQASLLRLREQRAADERRVEEARRAARDAEDRARRAEAEAARARAEAGTSRAYPVWGYGGPVLVSSPHFGGYTAGCRGPACSVVPQIWPSSPASRPVVTTVPPARPLRPSSLR